jgi:DNA-binding NtrC family response regulator
LRVEPTNLRLDNIQKSLIDAAMDKSGKNISKAAQALGISRRTLHRKLAQASKKGKISR